MCCVQAFALVSIYIAAMAITAFADIYASRDWDNHCVSGLLLLLQACNDFASMMEDSKNDSDNSQTNLTYSSTSVLPASVKACDGLQPKAEHNNSSEDVHSQSKPDHKPSSDNTHSNTEPGVQSALPISSQVSPASPPEQVKIPSSLASN